MHLIIYFFPIISYLFSYMHAVAADDFFMLIFFNFHSHKSLVRISTSKKQKTNEKKNLIKVDSVKHLF